VIALLRLGGSAVTAAADVPASSRPGGSGSSSGRVNIELPLATVAGPRTGDRIALDAAVFSEGDVAASAVVQPRARGAGAARLFMLFGRPR
jgi:hypothetical protein